MTVHPTSWWAWLLPLLLGSPWIAGIVWLWRHRIRDGSLPPSMAEQTRARLWGS
jgi:hypothetical protein